MKILIVDDEILVRIGIKSCIEWEKYGLEIIGEAEDGAKAIELIVSLRPDIVLLDIKMPKMDGLQVMRHINDLKLDCRVVILSSFDDYEHIGEAMKLGMSDYLHKPRMSAQDILDSLLSVKESIERSKRFNISKQNELMLKDVLLTKETILHRLLSGIADTASQTREKLSKSGAKLGAHNLRCILFSVKNLEVILKRYENAGRNVLEPYVSNIMNSILETEKGVEFLAFSENLYAILTSSDYKTGERSSYEKANDLILVVIDAMTQFLNIDVIFGVSDVFGDIASLNIAFAQASKALSAHFYQNGKHTIFYAEIKKYDTATARKQIDELVSILKEYALNKRFDRFSDSFEDLAHLLSENACLSEDEVKNLFSGLLFLTRDGQSPLADMEEISKCNSFDELSQSYKKLFGEHESKKQQEFSFLVKRIVNYIKDNYSSDITLKLLSQVLSVSPNYISRVFKTETGQGLFDYLNFIRIENAKKLLENGSLKIYEVGYKVGFKSPVHFAVVFNKLLQMTPKQYRDNLRV